MIALKALVLGMGNTILCDDGWVSTSCRRRLLDVIVG
jgi:hypothetical protein